MGGSLHRPSASADSCLRMIRCHADDLETMVRDILRARDAIALFGGRGPGRFACTVTFDACDGRGAAAVVSV